MKRHTTAALLSATVLALSLPLATLAFTPGEDFLANWDFDGDGKVTVEEVLERRGVLFDGFDADEDGFLSAEELADHNAMRDAMQSNHERPDMAQGGWGRQGGQRQGMGPMGGQGRGMGPQGGAMMQQPGWGYGQPQGGWGNGRQKGGWAQPPMGWSGYGHPQGYNYGPPQGYGAGPGWGGPQGMMQPAWGPQGGMAPQGFGPGMGRPGMGPQMGQPGMGPQQMSGMLDADGDGQISREEFVKAGEGWLPRFDRNADGVVDATDFPAPRAQ